MKDFKAGKNVYLQHISEKYIFLFMTMVKETDLKFMSFCDADLDSKKCILPGAPVSGLYYLNFSP